MTSGADRPASVAARYGLTDPDSIDAVVTAYDVVSRYSGPFLTGAAADILSGLRSDANADPRRVAMFLGRDGLPLAAAAHALDPQFSAARTRTITLSRVVLEHALRDLEDHRTAPLALPDGFRVNAPGDTTGAYRALTRFLRDQGVPVNHPDSVVTVVDTSYKGTSQEMLAAAYPRTEFSGRYAFFGAHPEDPHPGTKTGHVLHRDPDPNHGYPLRDHLPADRGMTFAHIEAIAAIEDLHHGPDAKPVRWGPDGPQMAPLESTEVELRDLNPTRVAPPFRDLRVREAVHEAALLAVGDTAAAAGARLRAGDPDWRAQLEEAAEQFTDELRTWIALPDPAQRSELDPHLRLVLDGFAHRTEREAVHELTAVLEDHGQDRDSPHPAWSELAASTTDQERHAVVAKVSGRLDQRTETAARGTPTPASDLSPIAVAGAVPGHGDVDTGYDLDTGYDVDGWDAGFDLG